jgi:hypothetical protein
MIWTVAVARKRFADFLRAAQNEPQRVEKYGELVGVMLGPTLYDDFVLFQRTRSETSLGASFAELRSLREVRPSEQEPKE